MGLLADIEGKRQENLASAVLRYLLAGSHEARDAFLKLLEGSFGPLSSDVHFAAYVELGTSSSIDGHGQGRLDLVLETDSALIGFEIKVWAGFQPGQPEKYVDSLKCRASQLSSLRGVADYAKLLAVIAPESRRREMENDLAFKRDKGLLAKLDAPCAFVSWERVLRTLRRASNTTPQIQYLVSELEQYVASIEGALGNFPRLAPHLHRWTPYGSRWHRAVVSGLWNLVPHAGPRLGASKSWIGYYTKYREAPESLQGWFGFVSRDQFILEDTRNDAELIFQLPVLVPEWEQSEFCRRTKLDEKEWGPELNVYVVNFSTDWDTSRWRKFLNPLQGLFAENGD